MYFFIVPNMYLFIVPNRYFFIVTNRYDLVAVVIHCGSGPNRFPPIQSFSPLTPTKTKNKIEKKKTENDVNEKNNLAPTGLFI